MCAPSTSASTIKITRWYLAASRSKEAPEPAPSTWMMAAHSAFLSMSATEAFCTLRILPRIGSSAWNSELRARTRGLCHVTGTHRREPLAHVVLGDGLVAVLEQPRRAQLFVEGLDQGTLKAGEVGAAFGGGDPVHEGVGHGVVAGRPAHRHV